MSDYMFMLESHLNPDQIRVVRQVQAAAVECGVNVFLTGGALRDMLAGFPISGIGFTVEGNGLKVARAAAAGGGAEILETEEGRKSAKLLFPGGVRASIGMAREEKYARPGFKPQISPASIHADLRGRDFTINSIALSLSAASRGLLIDPNNGVGDIQNKELRAVTNFTLYEDPVRLLRLQRFKIRLGFAISERTQSQYANAREAGLESRITPAALLEELRYISRELLAAEVVTALDQEKLLALYTPALACPKLNLAGLHRLQKAWQLVPWEMARNIDRFSLFLSVFTEKLSEAERTALVAAIGMPAGVADGWRQLEASTRKLERDLKSAKLQKPSHIYRELSKAPVEQSLYLLLKSSERLVQDRIRNYYQKYLPAAEEISDPEVLAAGGQPNTPKFAKIKAELISARLDARPKKPAPPAPPPENAAPPPDAPPQAPPPVIAPAPYKR